MLDGARPLVSICIPTYNRARLLRQTLPTVLGQEYTDIEVVICDNGSTDETEDVCRHAAQADARVRYLRHPVNVGLYANCNVCIEQSKGEFFCLFHDDDLYSPGMVGEYVAFLRRHPEVGIVCSDVVLIDGAGHTLGVREHPVEPITPGLGYIEQTMRSGRSSIAMSGAMIRRVAIGDVRFDERGGLGFADFAVWFEVAERWAVGHIARRLWSYRLHVGQLSGGTIEATTRDYHETLVRYCREHLERWPEHEAAAARWRRYIERFLFWALAYEICLHCRERHPGRPSQERTIFEMRDYRLTPEEFRRAREQLRRYRRGWGQSAVTAAIDGLLALGITGPLAWATQYSAVLRSVLRLR